MSSGETRVSVAPSVGALGHPDLADRTSEQPPLTGATGPLEVVGGRLEPATLESTLRGILRADPAAIVLAMNDGAKRVPLPSDDLFATCRELPDPGTTVMDFVQLQDRMAVVDCWERARAVGLGQARVRLSLPTQEDHTLTIVDLRARHDVLIEVLVPADGVTAGRTASQVQLPVPTRPRTVVMHKNLSGVIVAIDDRTEALLGWSAADMVGHRSLDFLHPDDHERAVGQWLEMRARGVTQRVRVRHRRRDGSWLWVEIENEYRGVDDPDGVVAVSRVTDVSEEMAAVEALRAQEALFRRLTESLPIGVVQIDPERRVVYASECARVLLGAGATASWSELLHGVDPVDRARLQEAVAHVLDRGAGRQVEVMVVRPDAPRRHHHLFTLAGLHGADGDGADGLLVSITDVTDSVQLREQLRVQASTDQLTGCLNRTAVLAALEADLRGPHASGLAVVFLDLDGFKTINDTAGHVVGDEVLRRIGRRLVAGAGREETVGRLGGDEFLVMCTAVADEDAARVVAERIRARLDAPLRLPAGRFRVRASFGVALAHPGVSPEALVAQADQAMYRAKRAGGDRVGVSAEPVTEGPPLAAEPRHADIARQGSPA